MSGYFDTTSAAEWLSNFTSSVGLDAWSVAIDTWLNATSFTSENVSVSSAYGIDVRCSRDDFCTLANKTASSWLWSTSDSKCVPLLLQITTDTQTLWRVGAFSFSFLFLIVVILTILVVSGFQCFL